MNIAWRWLFAAAIVAAGCDAAAKPAQGNTGAVAEKPPAPVVDSILPVEEQIRRFQATVDQQPKMLEGGATSRDELVGRFVKALATRDIAELRALLVTRAEFAYFYYPESIYTRKPYELSPEILWMQLEHGTATGSARALQRIGGKPLELQGYECRDGAKMEGSNRLWNDCLVRIGFADAVPARLFGFIIERDGVFKFLSYANPL
jgi:hypothetical protein